METTYTCTACERDFIVEQYSYNGIEADLRCDKCGIAASFEVYDHRVMALAENVSRFNRERFISAIESHLRPCDCGGTFRANAPYRCPHCSAAFTREKLIAHVPSRLAGFPHELMITNGMVSTQAIWFDDFEK